MEYFVHIARPKASTSSVNKIVLHFEMKPFMPTVGLELLCFSVRATSMQKKRIRCKYSVINRCLFNTLHLWDNEDTDTCSNRCFRELE